MKARTTFTDVFRSLGRGYTFYPSLVKIAGSVNACIMLSLLIHWHGKGKEPAGWIYKTQIEIEEETGLKKDAQQAARKELKRRRYLREKYADNPRRLYYLLDTDAINAAWLAEFGHADPKPEQNQHNAVSTATRGGDLPPQEAVDDRLSVYNTYDKKITTKAPADPVVVVSSVNKQPEKSEEKPSGTVDRDIYGAVRPYLSQYPGLLKYGQDTLLRALLIVHQKGFDLNYAAGTGRYLRGVCENGAIIPQTLPGAELKPEESIDPHRAQIFKKLQEGTEVTLDGKTYTVGNQGLVVGDRTVPLGMLADMVVTGEATLVNAG